MSLQLIYGVSGSGKTSYLFNKVQQEIKTSKHNIKIITPEQFSFTAEKQLLETSPSKSMLKAEVITFNRMAYRVLNEVGGIAKKRLSTSGRAMLINHILLNSKEDFSFIGSSEENVEMVSRQITELKKHNIKLDTLNENVNNIENKYLQIKLKDISTLYDLYTKTIEDNYIDENDGLTLLNEKLEKSTEFKNCNIYIDEFVGFTPQEYEIIKTLMKISNKVTITICADNLQDNTNPDIDIFYANKQTANKILKLAKEENIEIEEPIYLNKVYRFKNKELAHLAQNMGEVIYQKYNENNFTGLSVFLANNPYSEIENVAIQITKLAKEGYKYENMAVITKNIDTYSSLCKAIFAKYNIPVFIDIKKDFSTNILVKFILSFLDIFAKNWSYESVFGYIKTGFLNLDEIEISILENYCIKYGIKGSKWYAKDWNFYDETEERKEQILYAKSQVVDGLLKFKQKLKGLKTVKEISKALYEFLLENNIDKKLNEKIEFLKENNQLEKAKEYERSFKVFVDLLDELVLVLGDKNITFEKYSKILKMGFTQSDLGSIPEASDQVIVGDVDRSRSHKVKIAFLIGLNDGVFPSTKNEEGFLDDNDRQILKNNGIELAKGTTQQLYDENFNIYKAFTTAEEKLYLSYLSSDSEGRSLRPSIILNKIKRIFPNLKQTSDIVTRTSEILLENTTFDELLVKLRDVLEGKQIDDIWYEIYNYYYKTNKDTLENALNAIEYKNIPETIKNENIQKLYGDTLKTSISKLEKYKSCAFSYYLKYGLKLKEKDSFKVEAIDTGNFMHEVINSFFERLEEENISPKTIEDEQIKNITEEIVEEKLGLKEYAIFSSIPKYRVLAKRLKKVIVSSMKYIVYSLKYSEFEVLGHEMEFKENKKYKPITFTLNDGKRVEITGKIDRVDIAKTPDGKYIRIIDYKSSIKNINLNEVLAGLQLQLLTYLDATCKNEDVLPAGVFYFNLIDPILNANSDLEEEQIEQELRKQFKMQGLILADSKIVKKMDTTLESGASDIVPAYINKDGLVSEKQNTINKKQFENLQKYIEKIIKQISDEILSGNIKIEPYYKIKDKKTPCEYCEYKSICQFNQVSKNNYKYISNMSKEEVLEAMKNKA